VDIASGGDLEGVISAYVTRPCLPPETCVVPGVDHGVSCTQHWISAKSHGPIGGCGESAK
jgi:hypothetical protein